MDWLPSSLTGSLLATIIMVGICLFIYYMERQRCLLWWALGWASFSARIGGDIGLYFYPGSIPILALTQLANLGIGYFLAVGTFAFMRKPVPGPVHVAAVSAGVLLLAADFLGYTELWFSLPAFLFIGLAATWTGIAVLRSWELRGLGGTICGWSLILWGLHRANHPLLGSLPWLAPVNYLVATVLTICVALGLMLAYFQRTKTALRVREQGYRQLLESANDAIFVAAAEGPSHPPRFLDANQVAYQRLGYTREEFLGLRPEDILPPEERPRLPELARTLAQRGRVTFESMELTESGRMIPVEVSLHQARWGDQVMTLSISRDISARKRAEAKINQLASIVANSEDSIIGFDLNGIITSWNLGAQKLYGYAAGEAQGMSILRLLPPGQQRRLDTTLESLRLGKAIEHPDTPRVTKDGRNISISVTISPVRDEAGRVVGGSAIGRDITAMKRQQEEKEGLLTQLRQSQKMEALGALAGGIAHDFNNILSVIMGNAEMALMRQRNNVPIAHEVERVIEASRRARDLVRQILAFSRRGEKERRPVALKPLIAETLKMLRSALPATLDIRSEITARSDLVMADPTQLHQVLLNLCTNAAQAMEPNCGVLAVSLREVEAGEMAGRMPAGLEPGPHLLLAVSDTGPGMTPEVQERALEPFFTTKMPGQGTGLGLSVVHGIVQSHGGVLRILSQPGAGSTFEVFLPRLTQEPLTSESSQPEIPRGSGHLLLVDDEEGLCEVERQRLQWLGYRVTAHTDSLAAWRVLERGEPFDLLIADLVMPGLTGLELARRAKSLRPGLPIIVCTGHPDKITTQQTEELAVKAVLIKPVSLEEMSTALSQTLAHKTPAAPH